jgi:hypothetical protein
VIGDLIDLSAPLSTGGRLVTLIQVHHTGGSELRTPAQVEQDALGRDGKGFTEDPYTVHVWRGGDVGELGVNPWRISWGRDPARKPAGAEGDNAHAVAVVVHGDYSRGPLPVWARDRLIEALVWACRSLGLGANAVRGHRELPGEATACPGFDMGEIRALLAAALASAP